jgi:hypothetical protein
MNTKKSLEPRIRGWLPKEPKLPISSGPIQGTSRNTLALPHTTKTRVVLGTAGLVLYGALTYLFLKNIIDNSTWIGFRGS